MTPRSHGSESSKAVGEPPTPEGWTRVGDELQSAASRMAEWILDVGADRAVPYEVGMAAREARSAVEDWTELRRVAPVGGAGQEDRVREATRILHLSTDKPWELIYAARRVLVGEQDGVGGAGVEKTTVLDGYFATGDYECFVFDKHEGPGGHHGDECRVYPDDLMPEGSKRKRGRWTISIRFEAASSVGEGNE